MPEAFIVSVELPNGDHSDLLVPGTSLQEAILLGLAMCEMRLGGATMVAVNPQPNREYSIPKRIVDSLSRYVFTGVRTGDFLRAVLSNDLMEATGRADAEMRRRICDVAGFLYNACPSPSFGTPEMVEAWVKQRGLRDEPIGVRQEWAEKWMKYGGFTVEADLIEIPAAKEA